MQGREETHTSSYSPPASMDLHMPQSFSYYSCIMENNAVFSGQPMAYTKVYGSLENCGRQLHDDLHTNGSLNSRILELRKEKSRDAARSRRGKENFEFYELAKMLPLPSAITSQLDKASIIRLTIAFLRLREFAANGAEKWTKDNNNRIKSKIGRKHLSNLVVDVYQEHEGTHILQSLDGFAISLNADGRFLYISETVSIYLGLSQVELTGSSVFDYVHQSDHNELAEQLGVTLAGNRQDMNEDTKSFGSCPSIPDVCYPVTSLMYVNKQNMNAPNASYDRAFCIRMKSTLTKRGCHFKSSGYRVVLVLGKLRPVGNNENKKSSLMRDGTPSISGFIGLAIALPPPSVHEVRLESDMFVTRLTFDFRIAHCEPKISELLDYSCDDVVGLSLYALCHGEDVHKIRKMHEDLLNKGQVMSNYFRLINKYGGYTWMQSCATLICNTKNSEEQSIVCVNYVLSGPQYSNFVMDTCQIPTEAKCKPDHSNLSKKSTSPTVFQPKSDETCDRRDGHTLCLDNNKNLARSNSEDESQHHQSQQQQQQPQQQQQQQQQQTESPDDIRRSGNRSDWPFWRPPTLM
ncbi:protein trachealess-like isoform X1 [Tigriopus californicus]|nr:protein trachealess-like isoform X1 [Tigriopus californicus]